MFWIIIVFVFSLLVAYSEKLNGTINLDDMFQSLADVVIEENPEQLIVKKLSVDLEELDLKNITNKLNSMRRTFNTTHIQETVLKEFETRRLGPQGYYADREGAHTILAKTKILDMMLQTIYMARHKIQQLESEPYFNAKDTSYRIAFMYRKIRKIWKRLYDLYTTMELNKHETYKYNKKFTKVFTYLHLHHKAAKLHIDFLYYWWILVKLHERFHFRREVPNTFAPP